jgi:hypothetical protein
MENMTVFYKCQLCGGMGETKIKHRRPAHWSTITISGPHTMNTEYDSCQVCTEILRGYFQAPTLPLEVLDETMESTG